MISAEAPILFAKACEMFITEMTIKGYYNAEKNDRKTLQRKDIAMSIARTETYDFLIDTIPKAELLLHVPADSFVSKLRPLIECSYFNLTDPYLFFRLPTKNHFSIKILRCISRMVTLT
jgi:hypothetical protein